MEGLYSAYTGTCTMYMYTVAPIKNMCMYMYMHVL